MRLRKDLPREYDETYLLTAKEQTIIIEISFVNGYLLNQIRMPMVKDMLGGDLLMECFQKCLSACILTFIKSGLITDEFYKKHKNVLDEENGIKCSVVLDTMGVSDLSYDLNYMISQYLTVLGHLDSAIPPKDELYGNKEYFLPPL